MSAVDPTEHIAECRSCGEDYDSRSTCKRCDRIDQAKQLWNVDGIDFDEHTDMKVSEGDGGAWVSAWVWVPDD